MEKYMNIKAPYKRQSSGGNGKSDSKSSKGKSKATLKTGNEYIRGITGSSALVSSYGTMNSKINTTKSTTGTYGRSNTLGKSHSFLGGKNNNNNSSTLGKSNSILGGSKSSSSSTGRRSIFSLRKK
uniref:Uncharacterized protein n=1 Tax=Clytia hemisphaerica TaxID=252671 RepID=A0A7M5V374_9CNID|eukprot:TCONS_00056969-protein